jgi:uncharacterized protein YbgA (DUF1722 family)
MRLVGDPAAPRLVTQKGGVDETARMQAWAKARLDGLADEELCGFIFKSDSPSSGMERVKVYSEKGVAEKKGVGVFARAFMERFPFLPVEEDGRLHDPGLRENFIERLFTYWRWRLLLAGGQEPGRLVEFHSRHKYLLMAHHPEMQKEMGRLVAAGRLQAPGRLFSRYLELLMAAMTAKATVRKHVNVLLHMMGYFKKQLAAEEKKELLDVIGEFQRGHAPLLVPLVLLRHYIRKYDQPYLRDQVYLNPHPLELRLRHHA